MGYTQHLPSVFVTGCRCVPRDFDEAVGNLLQIRIVPGGGAEQDQTSHSLGLKDLTHREARRSLCRAQRIEESLGPSRERLSLLISESRRRDHGHDVFRKRQEVDREGRQHCLEGISLLLAGHDFEGNLAIPLHRVPVVGAS